MDQSDTSVLSHDPEDDKSLVLQYEGQQPHLSTVSSSVVCVLSTEISLQQSTVVMYYSHLTFINVSFVCFVMFCVLTAFL